MSNLFVTNIRQVNAYLAAELGINEAFLLTQLDYWLSRNSKAEKRFENGRYWIWNTYSTWREQFPWLSERTILRVVKSLEDKKLIIVKRLDKKDSDQTNWYTIDYNEAKKLEIYISHKYEYEQIMDVRMSSCETDSMSALQIDSMSALDTDKISTSSLNKDYITNNTYKDYIKKYIKKDFESLINNENREKNHEGKNEMLKTSAPKTNCSAQGKEISLSPIQSNHLGKTKAPRSLNSIESMFEEFWSHYPRQVGKIQAKQAFQSKHQKSILPSLEFLLQAINNQKEEKLRLFKASGFAPDFPYPATWINKERWNDPIMSVEETNAKEQIRLFGSMTYRERKKVELSIHSKQEEERRMKEVMERQQIRIAEKERREKEQKENEDRWHN